MTALEARASGEAPRAPDLTAAACAARGSAAAAATARRGRRGGAPWGGGGADGAGGKQRKVGDGEVGWSGAAGEEADEVEMAIHFTPRCAELRGDPEEAPSIDASRAGRP